MTDRDATTEAELRAISSHLDPVPQLLDDAARAAFTWRTVDAELAELMRDSAEAEEGLALARGGGGPRQLDSSRRGWGSSSRSSPPARRAPPRRPAAAAGAPP